MQYPSKISIIIPTLNEENVIGNIVRYLKSNGGGLLEEIIVVDGGSKDKSLEKAQKAGAKALISPKMGRAAQMNFGAEQAKGNILYFVHADTRPPESFATDITDALKKGKPTGCYRYQFDSPSWMLKINAWMTRFNWSWSQGGDKTFYIPRELFFQLGCYDEYYVIMEEYDFLKKVRLHYPLHIIQKDALVSARKYEGRSWLRVQIANLIAFNQFRFGVHPEKIKKTNKKLLG